MASDVHPSAPQPRRSLVPILLVLVVLALAGAATAYWWFELREKSPGEAGQTPVGEVSSESPSAPPAERITATLEAGSGAEESVTAPRAGRVGWIAETGSDVAEGAPVVKLDGFQMRERNLQVAEESQRRYQERLDQATSKDDKAGMKRAEADVKRKQNDIERIRAELAGYVVSAPIAGVVEPVVELKAAVAEGEPVARIATHAGPKATFTVPAGRTFAAGDQLAVTSVADPDLRATCAVDAVEGSSVTVTCPSDSGLAAGSAVALE
jgi:multidrug efflux pump subunit AcrA (membrane-fusion protein)